MSLVRSKSAQDKYDRSAHVEGLESRGWTIPQKAMENTTKGNGVTSRTRIHSRPAAKACAKNGGMEDVVRLEEEPETVWDLGKWLKNLEMRLEYLKSWLA